jgi:hypothetical protein
MRKERDDLQEKLDQLNAKRPEVTLSEYPPDLQITMSSPRSYRQESAKTAWQSVTGLGGPVPQVHTPATGLIAYSSFKSEFIMQVTNEGDEKATNIVVDIPRSCGLKVTFDVPDILPGEGWSLLSGLAEYRDGTAFHHVDDFAHFLREYDQRLTAKEKKNDDALHLIGQGQRVIPVEVTYNDRRGNRYVNYYHLVYYRGGQRGVQFLKFNADGHEMRGPDGNLVGEAAVRTSPPVYRTSSVREEELRQEQEARQET